MPNRQMEVKYQKTRILAARFVQDAVFIETLNTLATKDDVRKVIASSNGVMVTRVTPKVRARRPHHVELLALHGLVHLLVRKVGG